MQLPVDISSFLFGKSEELCKTYQQLLGLRDPFGITVCACVCECACVCMST